MRKEQFVKVISARALSLTRSKKSYAPNDKFAAHLYRHAADWFVFLADPTIEATNWLAEQAIRVAVVNRKVWGGNRTWNGAQAQGVISSVIQTCRKQSIAIVDFLSQTLRGHAPKLLPSPS
jgi:transposase